TDAALALLEAPGAQPVTRSYFGEHRAHILALAGRWPEAAEAYRALVEVDGVGAPRMRIAAAAAALEAGRRVPEWRGRAIAMLGGGPADDPVLAEARARLVANPRMAGRELGAAVTRPAEGVGLLFLRLATDLSRDRNPAPPLAFARLATFAAPGIPETWLVTADTLGRQEQVSLALEALDNAPQSGPLLRAVQWRRATLLSARGDHDAARAVLRPLALSPDGGMEDWVRLADIDRAAENHAGTIDSMTRAIAMLGTDIRPEHGYLFFLRGAALEQADRFPEAEADLRRALELQPDNAIYLNYLGYSLLDRGRKLDEAEALIARAFVAEPENGAIIDSMGWAAFVRGRFDEAVTLLEKARAAEPADPTIADHLGDALWRVGRRIEARHAWAAARALDPPEKLGQKIDLKLNYGLDAALAAR
ncbi:MAG: tetratricopeptide repeat protein, partial [Thermaurantiacus sp.]